MYITYMRYIYISMCVSMYEYTNWITDWLRIQSHFNVKSFIIHMNAVCKLSYTCLRNLDFCL